MDLQVINPTDHVNLAQIKNMASNQPKGKITLKNRIHGMFIILINTNILNVC